MEIEVLDKNYELIAVIAEYESFIWTDRYNTPGDFEIFSPPTGENLQYFARDNYIRIPTSDRLMIIEDIVYESHPSTDGRHVKVTGRSLESLLDRRIVWGKYNIDGNLQNEIRRILVDNVIMPSDPDRAIPGFIFEPTNDERITKLTTTNQYDGENVLKIIEDLTAEFDIGWKITLNDNKQLVFSLYAGTDRSYQQNDNPFVVFSPEYENIIESSYTIQGSALKTVILVSAQDSGYESDGESASLADRPPIYRVIGGGSGILRRETFASASGIKQDEGMSRDEYIAKIDQFGSEELSKQAITKKFDGQYETKVVFKYGIDFFIGDTVEVIDEFNNQASSKIIEFIWSNNVSNGEEAYPTFRSNETNEE